MTLIKSTNSRTIFLSAILTFTLFVRSGYAADYAALQNDYDKFRSEIVRQTALVQSDHNYVQSASASMRQTETSLRERAVKLRNAAGQCRKSLANGTLDICTVKSRGREISIQDAEDLAAKYERTADQCAGFVREADLDARTLADRWREINTLEADLREWKTLNDEAVADQLTAIAGVFLGQLADYMAGQIKAVRTLNRLVKQNRAELIARGVNVPLMESRLIAVNSKYMRAKLTAMTGRALQETDPLSLYDLLENTILMTAQLESKYVDSVRAIARDPAVQELIRKEHVDLEIANILFQKDAEKFLGKKEIQSFLKLSKGTKVIPAIGIASLGIDTLYNGSKWWASFEQIKERYDLSEQSNKAVMSLHDLVNRRKNRWTQCANF
jgi:hypothetical protein